MWSDPYISKQMLKYHLSFGDDIASRKLETIEKTVDFIDGRISKFSSVCDFGCGPGLYTNLLEKKGYEVIGIDISDNSLEYARSVNPKVRYINMNYVEKRLDEKVDVILNIYCDFGALSYEARDKVLDNVYHTLNENGLFIFDVFSINRYNKLEEKEVTFNQVDGFFMEGHCDITSSLIKMEDNISLSYDKAVGNKTIQLYNWDKHYSVEEIKDLVGKHGFKVIDYFSDTVGNKEFDDNELFMFICEKSVWL
jgi:SAM-dependent methyltransferase